MTLPEQKEQSLRSKLSIYIPDATIGAPAAFLIEILE
jgi:hypothetical protein